MAGTSEMAALTQQVADLTAAMTTKLEDLKTALSTEVAELKERIHLLERRPVHTGEGLLPIPPTLTLPPAYQQNAQGATITGLASSRQVESL